jgi:hypothetical protein
MANEFIARKGIISLDSAQVTGSLSVTNNISASIFTGSFVGDGSGLTGVEVDSFPYTGSAIISGSLEVTGSISTDTDATINSLTVGKGGGNQETNTVLGYEALISNVDGEGSVAIGYKALSSSLAEMGPNTAVGNQALRMNVYGFRNTAVGSGALFSNIGGIFNTAVGNSALVSSTDGSYNVGVGDRALYENTSGSNNIAIGHTALNDNTTGDNNVALGNGTLYNNLTGSNNTALGTDAGQYAGASITGLTSVNNSIFIGYQSRALNATGDTNEIVIGHNVVGLGSNTTVIGNNSTVSTTLKGAVSASIFSGSFVGDGSQLSGVTAATTASYVEYNNVANKPPLVSGSEQISFNGIVDKPTLVSGSSQIIYSGLTGIPSGIVSGSAQILDFGILATTGSNGFNGSQAITGSLTVTGQITAQTLNVQQVTSSIVYSSGSNIFGNDLSNTQQFTGSLQVSGSSHSMFGTLGLGTTNAVANLTVKENESCKAIVLYGRTSDNLARIDFYRADETCFAGRIQIDNGTTSNMSIRAQGNIQLQTGGSTNRLIITNTGIATFACQVCAPVAIFSGCVGIGTSNPSYKLEVYDSSTDAVALFNSANANGGHIRLAASDTVKSYIGSAAGFITSGGVDDLGLRAVGAIRFATNGAGTDMMLDTSGNLGLGVTPSAWGSTLKALQINTAVFSGQPGAEAMRLGSNWYFDGGMKYQGTGFSTLYAQDGGNHAWLTAPSGTANCAISFTQAMTLGSNSGLSIGTTSAAPSQGLLVQGASTLSSNVGIARTAAARRLEIQQALGGNAATIGLYDGGGSLTSVIGTEPNTNDFQIANSAGIRFYADSSIGSVTTEPTNERMRITSSGNLGLGVTPSAWSNAANYTAMQLKNAFFYFRSSSPELYMGNNAYYNGSSWIYNVTAPSAKYDQVNSEHSWYNAPSGTAGCAISFTQAMTLNASGFLGIGETNPASKLHIQSSASGGQNIRVVTSVAAGRNYMQFVNGSGDMGYMGYGGADSKFYINNQLADDMLFVNNGATRLTIASTGAACFACELTAKSLGTNDLILNNLNHEHANYVDGTRGSWLIQEGACDLFIINQVSCKKYKFNLIEIN